MISSSRLSASIMSCICFTFYNFQLPFIIWNDQILFSIRCTFWNGCFIFSIEICTSKNQWKNHQLRSRKLLIVLWTNSANFINLAILNNGKLKYNRDLWLLNLPNIGFNENRRKLMVQSCKPKLHFQLRKKLSCRFRKKRWDATLQYNSFLEFNNHWNQW